MKGEYIMVNSRKEEMKGTEKDKKEKKSVQKKNNSSSMGARRYNSYK
jgi:hypothetical protein